MKKEEKKRKEKKKRNGAFFLLLLLFFLSNFIQNKKKKEKKNEIYLSKSIFILFDMNVSFDFRKRSFPMLKIMIGVILGCKDINRIRRGGKGSQEV